MEEFVCFLKRVGTLSLKSILKACGTLVLVFAVALFSGGCLSWLLPEDGSPDVDGQAVYVPEGDPLIKAGLVLKVSVTASGSPAVAEDAKEVNANGEILMPLIGAVKCEGLTIVQLQDKIKESYKNYYIEPLVTVGFIYQENAGMKSPWGSVLVTGDVMRPGPVNMTATRDLTVTRALMLSGGVRETANKNSVRVTRRQKDGALKRYKVDIDRIGKEGRTDLDLLLKPGDVVWVPESWY